jgi:hypothetical protein
MFKDFFVDGNFEWKIINNFRPNQEQLRKMQPLESNPRLRDSAEVLQPNDIPAGRKEGGGEHSGCVSGYV